MKFLFTHIKTLLHVVLRVVKLISTLIQITLKIKLRKCTVYISKGLKFFLRGTAQNSAYFYFNPYIQGIFQFNIVIDFILNDLT